MRYKPHQWHEKSTTFLSIWHSGTIDSWYLANYLTIQIKEFYSFDVYHLGSFLGLGAVLFVDDHYSINNKLIFWLFVLVVIR